MEETLHFLMQHGQIILFIWIFIATIPPSHTATKGVFIFYNVTLIYFHAMRIPQTSKQKPII